MADLSILADYTRYSGTGRYLDCTLHGIGLTKTIYAALRDSLTVDKGRNPGTKFVRKMLQLVLVHTLSAACR